MKVLIVYDSMYGNTEQIAKAIGDGLHSGADVSLLKVDKAGPGDITGINLLIVGSPTQGSKQTVAIQEFLNKLPETGLKGLKIVAFDTRMTNRIIRMFGYAAPKITKSLEGKGAVQIIPPEGFWVTGSKGPLKEGELARATQWAASISSAAGK